LLLENTGDTPAKVVRTAYRDGKPLSDEEQGSVSSRTNRLFMGETRSMIQDWQAGLEIHIEVHEGKMYVEVEVDELQEDPFNPME
jgi:hypothetical protein